MMNILAAHGDLLVWPDKARSRPEFIGAASCF